MTRQRRVKLGGCKYLRPVVLDSDEQTNGLLSQNLSLTLLSKPPAMVPKRLTPISVTILILPPLDKKSIIA